MLISLSIAQYTIAEKLSIDFEAGMTAITGETGAGKSIALDALGLALGARADSAVVRYGSEKADIRAVFDISELKHVKLWLQDNDFDFDDCSEEDNSELKGELEEISLPNNECIEENIFNSKDGE